MANNETASKEQGEKGLRLENHRGHSGRHADMHRVKQAAELTGPNGEAVGQQVTEANRRPAHEKDSREGCQDKAK